MEVYLIFISSNPATLGLRKRKLGLVWEKKIIAALSLNWLRDWFPNQETRLIAIV